MSRPEKIIVGMSGGVDSSVSALLLREQGFCVEGLFMKNWDEDDGSEYCTAKTDLADAQNVCRALDIPLHTANFAAEYWDNVFEHFLAEYRAGRTPNPDILCNREIKFKVFLEYANVLGADGIATGHYARIAQERGRITLRKALDTDKDQSYFLYAVDAAALARTVFPLGELTKPAVRRLAAAHGLQNHSKRDSTGICFIGERRFRDFLARYLPAQPGDICTADGRVLGRHQGLMFYTLGQRQGIGIGGIRAAAESPWYVVDKDLARNRLVIGQGHDHPLLLSSRLRASGLAWILGDPPAPTFRAMAKTRYRQADQACEVTVTATGCEVAFDQPQRAVTPGQSVVFYQDEVCLGGGIIDDCTGAACDLDAERGRLTQGSAL